MMKNNGDSRIFSLGYLVAAVAMMLIVLMMVACGGGGGGDGDGGGGAGSAALEGTFVDSHIEGLEYESHTYSGVTDKDGKFQYKEGETVSFYIGDLFIGEAKTKDVISPLDLVPDAANESHRAVVNIARLLQTLDQDGNPDNGITITELARKTLSGFHSLDFDQSPENFSDDPDLKQLMNKLNDAGVFGAEKRTLQDVDTALKHLKKTLQEHPIIVLKAPNGGEELMAGDDCEITWKATSSITNVAILVSTDGGETWNEPPITDSTPNDGSYVWSSVSAFAGSDCRIKVADTSTDVYDESKSDFTVLAAAAPPPEDPRIQVVSPNGGEILQAGGSYEITWAAAGVEQLKIELSTDAGKTYTEIATVGAPGGAFIWQLSPQESLSNFCRIKISDTSDLNVFDVSDTSFAIRRCVTLACVWHKVVESAADDSDSDLLPDDVEMMLGTDLNERDTDQDSQSDFDELFNNWSGNDSDRIPDLDNDGVIAALDGDDNGDGVDDKDQVDTDGDGIPNYLEYNGFTYDWLTGTYALWDGISTDVPYFKTDPLQLSTDQDPYSDAAEASGNLLDVLVDSPGDLPMVPAIPNIVVRLEGYDIALNGEITYGEGGSLAEESSWSRDTSDGSSFQWGLHASGTISGEIGIGKTADSKVGGSITFGGHTDWTSTESTSKSVGQSIIHESNWQKATSVTPTVAARIKLKLKVYNYGTAAASNVLPTLTMKIGGMNVLTFKPANPINIIVPGGTYPPQQGTYWVVDKIEDLDTEPYLHLTLKELRALELGAPISIAVTQMESDVMLLNADGQWESAGNWGEYAARCDAVSSNIFFDTGFGRFIHHMVYSDDSVFSPQVTFGDALNWIAGFHTDDTTGEPYISYYDPFEMQEVVMPLEGSHFIFDEETMTNNGWDTSTDPATHPLGDTFNVYNTVLGPRSVVIGKVSPDIVNQAVPKIHYAYYDEKFNQAVVLASDYIALSSVVLKIGGTDYPMTETITGAGYYELNGGQSNCCDATCTVLAMNINGHSVEEKVECLKYKKVEPKPPEISSVTVTSAADGYAIIDVIVKGTEEWPVAKVWVYDPANPTVPILLDRDLKYWSDTQRYYKKLDWMPTNQIYNLVIVAETDSDTCTIHDPNCYSTKELGTGNMAGSLEHGEGEMRNLWISQIIGAWTLYGYIDFFEEILQEGGVKFGHYNEALTLWGDTNSENNAVVDHPEAEVFMVGINTCGGLFDKKHVTYFRINAKWVGESNNDSLFQDYDDISMQDIVSWANNTVYIDWYDPYEVPVLGLPNDGKGCEEYPAKAQDIVVFQIPDTTYYVKFMFYDFDLGKLANQNNTVKYKYDVYDVGN